MSKRHGIILAEKQGLAKDALEKGSCWGREYNLVIGMSKARKLGWTTYVLSYLFRVLGDALTFITGIKIRGACWRSALTSWLMRRCFRK